MFTSFSHYANSSNAVISVTFGRPRVLTDPAPPSVPLVSTGSLQLHFLQAATKGNIYLSVTEGWTSYRFGEVRALTQAFEKAPISGVYGFGLYILANQTDMSESGSGRCYMVVLDNQAGARRMWIGKSPNCGTNISAASILSMITTDAWNAQAMPLGLCIKWNASAAATTIIVQTNTAASATDPFTGLATVLSATDTTSPLTSSVAAGIYGHNVTATPEMHVFFDSSEWRQRFV
jgi:hypothetical protein